VRLLAPFAVLLLTLGAAACGTAAATHPKVSTNTVDALITAGTASQRSGAPKAAAALYATAIADDPTNAVALYDLGDLDQIALHDESAAEVEYGRALAVDPRFVEARFNLAILQSARHPQRAISSYETIIGFDASDADAYLNLGYLLRGAGETGASAAAFQKALSLDPALKSRIGKPIPAK
jgi:tetratricopeptide (TPR) repeat protein